MKYNIPSPDPSKVTTRINKTIKTTYGNIAVNQAILPDVLTLFMIIRNNKVQDKSNHSDNSQSGVPIPSSILAFSFMTSFLKKQINKCSTLIQVCQ